MPKKLIHTIALISVLLLCANARAETSALTLQEAIDRALENNLGFTIERMDTDITQEQEIISDAAFDPQLSLSANYSENNNPVASSSLTGASKLKTKGASYDASISKEIKGTGTDITLGTSLNRSQTNSSNATLNPDITSDVELSISQPLLKGRGSINLAPLARAQTRSRIAYLELQQATLNLIEDVENAYWSLATERERLRLRQSNHTLAAKLLEETQQRLELGLATEADVLQARAQLASQEEAITLNKQSIADTQDALRELMGTLSIDDTELETASLPEQTPPVPPFGAVWAKALQWNETHKIYQEELTLRQIDATVAKNDRLPDLDLSVSGAYRGRANRGFNAYNRVYDRDAYRFNTGVSLSFPWGRRSEQASYRVAQKRVKRTEELIEQSKQNILLEARKAWRSLQTNLERVTYTQAALQFTQEAYEAESARYREGLATFRNTLEAQRDLDSTRQRALDSQRNVLRAHTSLSRLDGSLLQKHGYNWTKLEAELPSHEPLLP